MKSGIRLVTFPITHCLTSDAHYVPGANKRVAVCKDVAGLPTFTTKKPKSTVQVAETD